MSLRRGWKPRPFKSMHHQRVKKNRLSIKRIGLILFSSLNR
jgi:hypothetical protein